MNPSSVPGPLRRPATQVRDRLRSATARQRTALERSRRRARVTAPVEVVDPMQAEDAPVVALGAGARLRAGLDGPWGLRVVGEDGLTVAGALDGAAFALVEVPAQKRIPATDAELARAAVAAGVPLVVWVTSSAGSPWSATSEVAGLVAGLAGEGDSRVWLAADDADTARAWSAPEAFGREVHHLPPAGSPQRHSPRFGGTNARREPAAALLGAQVPDLTAFAPVPHGLLDTWTPDDDALTSGTPVLARYREVVGLGGDARLGWPLIEAATSAVSVVVDEPTARLLPGDVREAVTVAEDAEALRLDVAARLWQDEVTDRDSLIAARAARRAHTWEHRSRDIERVVGIERPARRRDTSVIVPTNRLHELDNVADNIVRQAANATGDVQLVLVLHGLDVDPRTVAEGLREKGVEHAVVVPADKSLTLGACMNLGIDASDGRYIAKVDDDNFYGRHYLTDLVDSFDHSGAGIVGKWAHYVWLRSSGAVILRFPTAEHRRERLVQGGAMLFDGDVARELRFGDLPRAVDTDILTRARQAGIETYSSDRFNFVSIRGTDRHAHTWPVADTAMMNRSGRVVFFGDPRPHVDI
ncbi:glycosyltransferase [Janibacter sp. G1551]|uniref:glycosyltransferase n=1 Tax=Janibacter sp. G1551 TaxID=3420440 RepID=UPI003CFCF5D7